MTKQENKKNREKDDKDKTISKEVSLLNIDAKKSITSVLLVIVALIFILSLFDGAGVVGNYVDKALRMAFGWGRFALPFLLIILGVVYFRKYQRYRYYLTTAGALIFFICLLILFHRVAGNLEEMKEVARSGEGGGFMGFALAYPLFKYFGGLAAVILSTGFLLIGFILTFNFPLNKFFASACRYYKTFFAKVKEAVSPGRTEEAGTEDEYDKKRESAEEGANIKEDSIKFADEEDGEDDYDEEKKLAAAAKKEYSKSVLSENGPDLSQNSLSEWDWELPSVNLLEKPKKRKDPKNLDKKAEAIVRTLEEFGIKVHYKGYNLGPSVVQYTFEPASGIKLSRILSYQDDLALSLASPSVRIEAPIAGRSLIGVEVPLPSENCAEVRVRDSIEDREFQELDSNLGIILGEDVYGERVFADIKDMPHLMVAGATGMGKSVCVNTILTSLLYQNTPEDLKLVLIDPKRVELNLYSGIPHLMGSVITNMSEVVNALGWAINVMDQRYEIMEEVGARDLEAYNNKFKRGKKRQVKDPETGEYYYEDLQKLPCVVIIIDELNDLMAVHKKEVEGMIVRLAQKSRAVGIHLILSTQKPSADVITSHIKANIPARIALKVLSQVHSRVILDRAGAEKLLGKGDMLFVGSDGNYMRRIQGAFVSTEETEKLVSFWKKSAKKRGYIKRDNEMEKNFEKERKKPVEKSGGVEGGEDLDDLFDEVKETVISTGKASTSFIQSKFSIGYQRANRIMMQLEENGVVGPARGSKPREILLGGVDETSSGSYEDPRNDDGEVGDNY
ncbi:MAG: DNA translocase FtsK 4TM domain-containing protein [Patescibacteria group bacterium]